MRLWPPRMRWMRIETLGRIGTQVLLRGCMVTQPASERLESAGVVILGDSSPSIAPLNFEPTPCGDERLLHLASISNGEHGDYDQPCHKGEEGEGQQD